MLGDFNSKPVSSCVNTLLGEDIESETSSWCVDDVVKKKKIGYYLLAKNKFKDSNFDPIEGSTLKNAYENYQKPTLDHIGKEPDRNSPRSDPNGKSRFDMKF